MSTYYHVAPRYTPGSPAGVRQEIAEQVAREEKQVYTRSLAGYYGEQARLDAERFGLAGIVEFREEDSRRKRWLVHDLCTDEVYVRPFPQRRGS